MISRLEQYGERLLGKEAPIKRRRVVHQLSQDPYIGLMESNMIISEAQRRRRVWFLDVARESGKEFVHEASVVMGDLTQRIYERRRR